MICMSEIVPRSFTKSRLFSRTWSLLVLLSLFLLTVTGRLISEPGRAVVALLSLALVAQCWRAQRRYLRSRSRTVLLALLLSLPALGSIWLGLNVVRVYSYEPDPEGSLHLAVIRAQDFVFTCAIVLGLIAIQWSIAEGASVIGHAVSHKLVGKKKTWWNRPLKGTWMLGSVIGYAIGLLIASSYLRWSLLAVAVLGIVFAMIFRVIHGENQI